MTLIKPIRKVFNNNYLFPFELVHKTLKKKENELPVHFHDHFEIVYIHEGKGVFFIDYMWYEKQKGDLFLIPGNTIHHSLPDSKEPIVSSVIFFAPHLVNALPKELNYTLLNCFDYVRQNKQYKLELNEQLKILVEEQLCAMSSELEKRQAGYKNAVWLTLCQLLLQLNRLVQSNTLKHIEIPQYSPSWMIKALQNIDKNPEYEHSLVTLASEASVSTAHFSRVFRQLTTMNITSYVNAKRIVKAKQLLVDTDLSIEIILEQCGFQTATHFYRVFKKVTGITPRQYANTLNKS